MYRSVLTSCMISAIGNNGARSSGPTGFCVPGCSTGGSGRGRSGTMLYHARGISDSSRTYLVCSLSTMKELLVYDNEAGGNTPGGIKTPVPSAFRDERAGPWCHPD